jgi:hypothetical protein
MYDKKNNKSLINSESILFLISYKKIVFNQLNVHNVEKKLKMEDFFYGQE